MKKLEPYALVVIALSAVLVSVWQINLTKEHNRLTVRPYVKLRSDGNATADEVKFSLWNKGAGAALVTKFELTSDGKVYDTWQSLFASIDSAIYVPQTSTVSVGHVIAPDEQIQLSTIRRRGGNFNFAITIRIEFESLYHEPFEESITFSRTSTTN